MPRPKPMKSMLGYCLALAMVAFVGTAIFALPALARSDKEASRKNQADADALFTSSTLHVLKIAISEAGMRSLRRNPRTDVPATLQEGPKIWTNVMIRLKGGICSFRAVDDKPGFTLTLADNIGTFSWAEEVSSQQLGAGLDVSERVDL